MVSGSEFLQENLYLMAQAMIRKFLEKDRIIEQNLMAQLEADILNAESKSYVKSAINNIERPLVVVIAGPNGSGKISFTTEFLNHKWSRNSLYINPDEIAQHQFGDWNSMEAVLKSAALAQQMREDLLAKRRNFIFETVLASEEKVDFLRRCYETGYFIHLFFIATQSPAINAFRVAQRVMKGGHDVPINKIISRYTKSIRNLAAIISWVDRAYIYDNSLNYEPLQSLYRLCQGQITNVYAESLPDWAFMIKKKIERVDFKVKSV